jgi:hypothetical protein
VVNPEGRLMLESRWAGCRLRVAIIIGVNIENILVTRCGFSDMYLYDHIGRDISNW